MAALRRRVNDDSLIDAINAEENLGWTAGPTQYYAGKTLGELPLMDSRFVGGALELPPAPHAEALKGVAIPDSFDARKQMAAVPVDRHDPQPGALRVVLGLWRGGGARGPPLHQGRHDGVEPAAVAGVSRRLRCDRRRLPGRLPRQRVEEPGGERAR